jgi:hypothetical protein
MEPDTNTFLLTSAEEIFIDDSDNDCDDSDGDSDNDCGDSDGDGDNDCGDSDGDGKKKLHTEELHNLYSSPNIIRMFISKNTTRSEHVAWGDENFIQTVGWKV